jgi:hypothetical protein
MPIYVTDIKFQDQYTGLFSGNGADGGTTNFMGCVGDLMWAKIEFYVGWKAEASFTINATDDTITIPVLSGTWSQYGFQVGDTIEIVGSSSNDGTYTIASLTDYVLTTVEDLTTNETTTFIVYGTSAVNYFDFYYNMLGNNDGKNFISITDQPSTQRFTGKTPDYASTQLLEPNSTSYAWWDYMQDHNDMKPQLRYIETSNYNQYFDIIFPFFIKPFSDKNQNQLIDNAYQQNIGDNNILNTVNFIEPSYFYQQCLGFLYQIDAKFDITKPQADHSSGLQNKVGNTAWFDQFFPSAVYFNGNVLNTPQYEFLSVSYNTGNEIQTNTITKITIELKKLSGDWDDDDKYVVHFAWLPTDAGKYLGYSDRNQQNFRYVFLYDRAYQTVNGAPVNGDMFGTGIQCITNLSSIYLTDILTITFDADLGGLTTRMLKEIPYYMIWVTPQDKDVTALSESDRSAILCDVNAATENTDDKTLLQFYTPTDNVVFYSENDSDKSDYLGLIGEYGFANCLFQVKENCILNKVNVSIVVQSSSPYDTQTYEFPIEQWNNNTAEYWNGKLTDINIEQIIGFDLPNASLENQRFIIRKPGDDIAGFYSYRLGFGFQVGYQFWQNIVDYPAQYLAYHNNYWAMYTQGQIEYGNYLLGDYTTAVKFKMYFEILDNNTGIITEFIHYANMTLYDGLNNFSDYGGRNYTMDYTGNDLNGGVLLDAPTYINSFFESKLSLNPIGSGSPVIEMIAYYELGNKTYFDKIRSDDTQPADGSAWSVIPALSVMTYQVSGTSTLDFTNFQTKPKNIRLYSKIYY